jgi:transcriptional regulator with XRE-family HTH domain
MRNKIEPFYEALGLKIQKLRDNRNMTQAQLGLSLHPPSTRASIANIENGKQRVLAHTLPQLARALGVELAELVPASDDRTKAPSTIDVERELKKKLNLAGPTLKKLSALANENPGDHA